MEKKVLMTIILLVPAVYLHAADGSGSMRDPALSMDADDDLFVSLEGRDLDTPSVGFTVSPGLRSPSTISALPLGTPSAKGPWCSVERVSTEQALAQRRYRSLCNYLKLAIFTHKINFQRHVVSLIEKWIVDLSTVTNDPVAEAEMAFWWANLQDERWRQLAISMDENSPGYTEELIKAIVQWVVMGTGDMLPKDECDDFFLLQEPFNLAGLRRVASTSEMAQASAFAETCYAGLRVTWPSIRPSSLGVYRNRSDSV